MLSRKLPRGTGWSEFPSLFSFSNLYDVKLRSRLNRDFSCVSFEDGMVQTNVGDGLSEAQKQSLLNSSLWLRSREAGSPGVFPHFSPVSSLLSFSHLVARKKTLVKARTRTQRPATTCRPSSGCECRGKGESDVFTILFLLHFPHSRPDADLVILPRNDACSTSDA